MEIRAIDWEEIALRMVPLTEEDLPLPQLADDEQVALAAIRSPKRQREWLASRWLVQQLLPYNKVQYTQHGKPYLSAFEGGFSISHSSQFAAIAFSYSCANVAVDVETISPRVCKIRHKFLSSAEQSFCAADDENYLTVLWCAKEAMFKLLENGSLDFETHYHIDQFQLADRGEIIGTYRPADGCERTVRMYYQQIGNSIAVLAR